MSARLKTILVTFVSLFSLWFVIIYMCLPPLNFDPKSHSHYSHAINEHHNDLPPLNRHKHIEDHQGNLSPTTSPLRANFGLENETLTTHETLYYEFDLPSQLQYHYDEKEVKITQKEHEKVTQLFSQINGELDKHVKAQGDKLFSFNLLASNRIGAMRPIPDTRNSRCPNISSTTLSYQPDNDYRASIIICYFNECPSALIRTISSILKRSPRHLLHEIIIVDDFSDPEFHHDYLRPIFNDSNLLTYMRTTKREGLIRARLFGAAAAKGEALIFLDSHVEPNVGWLEPLMNQVRESKTTVACPIIDLINAETMIYTGAPMVVGGMSWNLHFKWDSVPSSKLKTYEDFVKPQDSPTMAGGLYAIDRNYFFHIGSYDEKMDLWGGENIEMSLRIWLCGGKIVVLPCSRVGHIFRKERPYGPPEGKPDSLLVNSHRTARVWLGGKYLERYYQESPHAKDHDSGDISERLSLKTKLECKNFTYYIDNVYPVLKEDFKEVSIEHPPDHEDNETDHSSLLKRDFRISTARRVDRSVDVTTMHTAIDSRMPTSRPMQVRSRNHLARGKFDMSGSQSKFRHMSRLSDEDDSIVYDGTFVSRFQIQASNDAKFCIESMGNLLPRDFTRLVLNYCKHRSNEDLITAISTNNTTENNGTITDNNKHIPRSLRKQLWYSTTTGELRLGRQHCLDMTRNMPSLRKCHSLGFLQNWTTIIDQNPQHLNHDHETSGSMVMIQNSASQLCLGVERLQVGEPLIATICDISKGRTKQSSLSTPSSSFDGTNRNKLLSDHVLRPSQLWTLVHVG